MRSQWRFSRRPRHRFLTPPPRDSSDEGHIASYAARTPVRTLGGSKEIPRAKLHRAAAAKLLYQSSNPGKKPRTCASKPYTDVAQRSAACRYISWSKTGKIIKPLATKKFRPAAAMTRGRLADALYRVAHDGAAAPRCAVKPFTDVKKSSSVCGAVTWAANTGVIPGATAKKFKPGRAVTRGQAAPILKRAATPRDR